MRRRARTVGAYPPRSDRSNLSVGNKGTCTPRRPSRLPLRFWLAADRVELWAPEVGRPKNTFQPEKRDTLAERTSTRMTSAGGGRRRPRMEVRRGARIRQVAPRGFARRGTRAGDHCEARWGACAGALDTTGPTRWRGSQARSVLGGGRGGRLRRSRAVRASGPVRAVGARSGGRGGRGSCARRLGL
jgi:hypothetical protein